MADDDQTTDLTILPPGADSGSAASDQSAEIESIKLQVTQLEAVNAELQNQLDALKTVPSAPALAAAPRLIGEDWSKMTAAEAKAAGCTRSVLCSDGYYIPG